jgi:predicted metal-dependent hydrolase
VSADALGEVIFEITHVGDIQRVAAVHVATGAEVVVQAPAGAALADVRALALKKLAWALRRDPLGPAAETAPKRGTLA